MYWFFYIQNNDKLHMENKLREKDRQLKETRQELKEVRSWTQFHESVLARTVLPGKYYTGAPGDFAPEVQKRALENKKEPLKIAIDCNVKACSMLQI